MIKYQKLPIIILISVLLLTGVVWSYSTVYGQTIVEKQTEIQQLEKKLQNAIRNQSWNYAATYTKKLALIYDKAELYDKAVDYYDLTATYWEKAGHPSWGIVNTIRADHIRTTMQLYVANPQEENPLEKFEPKSGTYLGFLVAGKLENWNATPVEEYYGKHALFLSYVKWNKQYSDTNSVFPLQFGEEVKSIDGALQVAWEPTLGLDEVKDNEYVRQFASEAKTLDIPIFLRFGGEMNGPWVPWSGDPAKYIEKFRLIHDIMEAEAPNVAMVWSPNFLPRDNIAPYYPGDEYVDWVGFSLYTIPFSHGEEVPGGNPIDYLRPLYKEYSHKPIMISEGAVSHYSYEMDKDFTDWAVSQLGNMYYFLPRLYPKVKAITYFNYDKISTNYDNKNNNYDLGDNEKMLAEYNEISRNGHFLSKVETGITAENDVVYVPIEEKTNIKGKQKLFTYIKLPLGKQPARVALFQGEQLIAEATHIPWDMEIDFSGLDATQNLTVIAYDKEDRERLKREFSWTSSPFKDIEQHSAKDAITTLYEEGIINGYNDGTFRPDSTITRAELVTLLNKIFKWESQGEITHHYVDIKHHWAANHIIAAAQNGVLEIAPQFRPNDPITYNELADFVGSAVYVERDNKLIDSKLIMAKLEMLAKDSINNDFVTRGNVSEILIELIN